MPYILPHFAFFRKGEQIKETPLFPTFSDFLSTVFRKQCFGRGAIRELRTSFTTEFYH